jgi:hypothetical protein
MPPHSFIRYLKNALRNVNTAIDALEAAVAEKSAAQPETARKIMKKAIPSQDVTSRDQNRANCGAVPAGIAKSAPRRILSR